MADQLELPSRADLYAALKNDRLVRIFERLLITVAGAVDPTAVQAALDAHIADPTDAHEATAIGFTPAGGIAANQVQAALEELDAEKQPADAELTAIAGLVSAADRVPYFTGAGTAALATFTAAGRALVDDADAAAQRTTLGLGTLATQNGTFSGTSSGTNTGDQTSIVGITGTLAEFNAALTGADFATGGGTATGTNTGDQFTSTTASRLIGRGSAAGAGAAQEITPGTGLSMSGTTLNATGKELLANVTLGSAGTSLASGTISARQFLEIHIYIEGYSGSDTASLRFNGDSGNNYRYRWLTSAAGGTTFAAGLVLASTSGVKVAAANTTNSRRIKVILSNDASVTEKLVQFESVFGTGSAGTQATIDLGNGAWISAAATQITSIALVSSSNMLAGTQMTVYGWN